MQKVDLNNVEHYSDKKKNTPSIPPPPVMLYTPTGIGYFPLPVGPPPFCPTVSASAISDPCICPPGFPAPRTTPTTNNNYCTVCPDGQSMQLSSDGNNYCMPSNK